MDFWDLTTLIFRRWKVALPLLLLAIGATVAVAMTAKPDYTMTSYVQFVPVRVPPGQDAIASAARNPWNQLGLATLGQAAIYTTQDQGFLESLKDSNHTDNFTLTMTNPNPIVTVEVVAATRPDARATTELVITRLRNSALTLQKQSGVQDADIIPTQRLDQGQNLVESGGKVKRAIAAVAAAGLLLVAGGTVAFDALARRRARRRAEREAAETASPEVPETAVGAAERVTPSAPVDAVVPKSRRPAESPPPAPPVGESRTAIVVQSTAKVVKQPSRAKQAAGTYRSAYAHKDADVEHKDPEPEGTNGDGTASPSDVRVVLQPKRLGQDDGGKAS
ncbi:MAG TPA: hypothetical protein VFH03_22260 [Actinoplanes sp.]|nr:hypothetical protein [Actinoplanes sp.]